MSLKWQSKQETQGLESEKGKRKTPTATEVDSLRQANGSKHNFRQA